MAGAAGPSRRPPPALFPQAKLRILSRKGVQRKYCHVVLAVSHRLFWKEIKDGDVAPQSLYDFKKQSSLELTRLNSTAQWNAVRECVMPDDKYGPGLVVQGRLHGRARWTTLNSNVKLFLIASDEEQRAQWVNELRLRIAPWELLLVKAREMMADASLGMPLDDLVRQMDVLRIGDLAVNSIAATSNSKEPSEPVNDASSVPGAAAIHARLQKAEWVEKLNTHFCDLTCIVAKAIKRGAEKGSEVEKIAEDVQDFAEMIPGGVSSIFHLVVLGARLASMVAEASRGRHELPAILVIVGELLEAVTESVVPILVQSMPNTSGKGELFLESNVFEVLVRLFDHMGKIEQQLMRSWQGQVFNSSVVKEVESELAQLKVMVGSVLRTRNERKLKRDVDSLKKNMVSPAITRALPRRPRKSPYFVGRGSELRRIKEAVRNHGSAAITGYGGLGKSQLMASFVGRAEKDGDVPGGTFWVTADGDASQVVEALAQFAEVLKGARIPDKGRSNPAIVFSVLKGALSERSGRWLLCMDNVDNAADEDVQGILEEVTSLSEPEKCNGWVVITSRCALPYLWGGMHEQQNVVLGPLSVEDAIYVLWRYKESVLADSTADKVVAEAVKDFKVSNENDYRALHELCGFGWQRSLAGLPLALAHAGSYIQQFQCTFSEYLQLYREANGKAELDGILRKARDFGLREEQRAILKTWSISMSRLSDEARFVISVLSMLGSAQIPEELMKEVSKNPEVGDGMQRIHFQKVVVSELVHKSSLLRRYRDKTEEMFEMHRLIRLFVFVQMEGDTTRRQEAFEKAILATHACVRSVLKEKGKRFDAFPVSREDRRLLYFPNSLSLVNGCTVAMALHEIQKVVQMHKFCGACLCWLGRDKAAISVYEKLLKIYRVMHGQKAVRLDIAYTLDYLGDSLRYVGRLKEAEISFQESLRMKYEIRGCGMPHTNIACSLTKLGNVTGDRGNLQEAEALYRKSLKMYFEIYGRNAVHSNISHTLHQLGLLVKKRGKYDEAKTLLKKSLNMSYAIHGQDSMHRNIGSSLCELGSLFKAEGNLDEAEAMYRKCLDMDYAIYGQDAQHSDIAYSLRVLGTLLKDRGSLHEAEALCTKSLNMEYAIHGQHGQHSNIACSLRILGTLLEDRGRLQEAEVLCTKALNMEYAIHGQEVAHSDIAHAMYNLGCVHRARGDIRGAEALFRKCVEMDYSIHGQDAENYDIALALSTQGSIFKARRNLCEAKSLYSKSLNMFYVVLGDDAKHMFIAGTLNDLGSVLQEQGNLFLAEGMFRKSLDMIYSILGIGAIHSKVALSLQNLGNLFNAQRKHEDAEVKLRASLEMLLSVHGETTAHPDIATSQDKLGEVFHAQRKLPDAGLMFRKALEMRLSVFGKDATHPDIADSFRNLGSLCQAHGELGKAEEMIRKSLNMRYAILGDESIHPAIAQLLRDLALILKSRRNANEADALIRKATDMDNALNRRENNSSSMSDSRRKANV